MIENSINNTTGQPHGLVSGNSLISRPSGTLCHEEDLAVLNNNTDDGLRSLSSTFSLGKVGEKLTAQLFYPEEGLTSQCHGEE